MNPGMDLSEEDVRRVVDRFYVRVRADALLGPVFDGAIGDWPEHLAKLQAFWSSVMLKSGRYKGQPMAAHLPHAEAMTPARFERWLALWKQTTSEMLMVDQASAMQQKADGIAESLRLGIAFHTNAASSPADRLADLRPARGDPA